jgi:hypothetical protein
MKSFTTLVLVASAALAIAQVTSNPDGTFTCAIPNAAYCAGGSLTTNIIIRCIGTVGQPGNCDDNLAGEPPFGVNSSPCWQPSATSGQAACSKNCIVYGGSGNYNGTFTLPNCTPSTTVTTANTSSSAASFTVPSSSGTGVGPISTGSGPTGGASISIGNGTTVARPTNGGSATATPVGPTTTGPSVFTGAAVANQAGAVLAVGGLLVAYFL